MYYKTWHTRVLLCVSTVVRMFYFQIFPKVID